MEFLCCARCSHDFEYENSLYHPITLPVCGHTMCRQCIDIICNDDQLPINYPLLMILYDPSKLPENNKERYGECPSYRQLDRLTKQCFNHTEEVFRGISLLIKRIINDKERQSIFSRSTIRKMFSLLNSQYIDGKGHLKLLKAIRSLSEHKCIDFILHHQNFQQLTDSLRSAIGLQNRQFLQPAMQEKILKSILANLGQHPTLPYKMIVHSVLLNVGGSDPYGIEPSVKHIVDLLYVASCFQVREDGNSSLIQLKSEFQKL